MNSSSTALAFTRYHSLPRPTTARARNGGGFHPFMSPKREVSIHLCPSKERLPSIYMPQKRGFIPGCAEDQGCVRSPRCSSPSTSRGSRLRPRVLRASQHGRNGRT